MKNRLFKTIALFGLSSFFLFSCTEVIQIDLNSTNPVVVAEGYVEPDSTATLRLTYTTDYYNMESAEVIEDAIAVITNQGGTSENMTYRGDGQYTSELLKGAVLDNYTLTIEVDGKTYSGISTLLPPADITSISYSELLIGSSEMTELLGYSLDVALQDIPGINDYYAFQVKKNGTSAASTYGLASNRINTAGNFIYQSQSFFVSPGDTIELSVYSIDFDAYKYYSEVNDGLSGNMIMSPAPYNAGSNLGEDIMGYFMARSRKDTAFIVPPLTP